MPRQIATLIYCLIIFWLFRINKDSEAKTSRALWLPFVWVAIAMSREVSQWLGMFGLGFGSGRLTPDFYLEGSPIDRFLSLGLTIFAIIVLAHRQGRVGTLLRANKPIILFFSYCAISIIWSDYPDVAFKRWIKAVGDLAMVLVVLTEIDPLVAIRRLFARIGFILLPLSLLFIKYYPEIGRSYSNFLGQAVYVGVTTNKNALGMITMLLGIACLWSFLRAREERRQTQESGPMIAQGILLGIVIWLFVMANSATSLSCFLMASVFLLAVHLYRFARKPVAAHIFALAVVVLSVIALFFNSGGELVGTLGRESTLTGRTDIWKLVLSMSGSPLFGTGFESFWLGHRLAKVWNVYRFHLNESHNGYLEVYVNLGWIGIVMLALLLVTGYQNLYAAFRRDPSAASLKLTFFVITMVYNLTEAAYRVTNPIWIVFILTAIAIPQIPTPEESPPIRIRKAKTSDQVPAQSESVLARETREESFETL